MNKFQSINEQELRETNGGVAVSTIIAIGALLTAVAVSCKGCSDADHDK